MKYFFLILLLSISVNALPDLMINETLITFNSSEPIQGDNITIFATVNNIGNEQALNALVSFFVNGTNVADRTQTINAGTSVLLNATYLAKYGRTYVKVAADPLDSLIEDNELNNNATDNLSTSAFSVFYGNVSIRKLLGAGDFIFDDFGTSSGLHVFVADSDSVVDFTQLQAIGYNSSNNKSSNDFAELDVLLNTSEFDDSFQNDFASGPSDAKETMGFTIFNFPINNVPVVNSTNSASFKTGILWDKTDDTDEEFDSSEKEDIVFFTRINASRISQFGTVDYEIRVPTLLHHYKPGSKTVDFYFEAR